MDENHEITTCKKKLKKTDKKTPHLRQTNNKGDEVTKRWGFQHTRGRSG